MRIVFVRRTPVVSRRNRKGNVVESVSNMTETKLYPAFSDRIIQDDADLAPLLEPLLPAGHRLFEDTGRHPIMEDEDLRLAPPFIQDGDSKPLPSVRMFQECLDSDSSPSGHEELVAYWTVSIDRTVGVRKVQVSLTLSSSLLERLRARAKERKISLSGLIDEYLVTAVDDSSAAYRDRSEHLLESIEQLIEDFRQISDTPASGPTRRSVNG